MSTPIFKENKQKVANVEQEQNLESGKIGRFRYDRNKKEKNQEK